MNSTKEVYCWKYCNRCKYKNVSETDEPCNECLTYPVNIDSHKPIKWEGRGNKFLGVLRRRKING